MQSLLSIAQALNTIGRRCYIVGWWCRHTLLGIPINGDIDLTTDATPQEMHQVLTVVQEVWKKYGTLIVQSEGKVYEITSFRKDIGILDGRRPVRVEFTRDLTLDAQRRDFTMNAIYFDLLSETFIDPVGGIADMKAWVIRFVGTAEERIDEDALRILRYIRLKHRYSLQDQEDLSLLLIEKMPLLEKISCERIKEEFDKILLLHTQKSLQDLKDLGFFRIFFPEIEALSKTPWGPRHHLEGNVWIHTLLTLQVLETIFRTGFETYSLVGEPQKVFFPSHIKRILTRTMLLHDIGKHPCFSQESESENVHYYGHETVWALMLESVFHRFRFPNEDKKIISWLIKEHLNVFRIFTMSPHKAKKLMMHPYFPLLLVVGKSDHEGRVPTDAGTLTHLLSLYQAFLVDLSKKKLYTGHDVLTLFPHLQWVQIKHKLQALNDQILAEIRLTGAEFWKKRKVLKK